MNYLELINNFWQCDTEHHLTPSDTRIYFYLLHTCNRLGWKIPFKHSDRHLALDCGMSVNTVREAKNRLKQRRLLDFKTPQKKGGRGIDSVTEFTFSVSKNNTLTDEHVSEIDTQPDTQGDTQPDTQGGNNNKQNKTKQKNNYRRNVKLKVEENDRLVKEFGEEFIERVYDYLSDYKIEKGYTSKDDNLTIRRWVIDAVKKKTPVIPMNGLAATGTTGRIYDPNDPKHKW